MPMPFLHSPRRAATFGSQSASRSLFAQNNLNRRRPPIRPAPHYPFKNSDSKSSTDSAMLRYTFPAGLLEPKTASNRKGHPASTAGSFWCTAGKPRKAGNRKGHPTSTAGSFWCTAGKPKTAGNRTGRQQCQPPSSSSIFEIRE
mmetsp:Transcript_2846/g.5074  ORF Transcript_2846/g.5074 Transcript_2846/m.5074 type:complete len:144 (-) Transcript_2846:893-1324(-)